MRAFHPARRRRGSRPEISGKHGDHGWMKRSLSWPSILSKYRRDRKPVRIECLRELKLPVLASEQSEETRSPFRERRGGRSNQFFILFRNSEEVIEPGV